MQTITRKFLVKTIPNLSGLQKTVYNRFYLYNNNGIVIRVQSVGDKYELERKADKTDLLRDEKKIGISKEEFEALSKMTGKNIIRDSYHIQDNPQITLRIYHGSYEGLVRTEVNFESVEASQDFKPLDWFGKEITTSPLAKDGTLLRLSTREFNELLNKA